MSICDLTSGPAQLSRATKELRDQWLELRKTWDDSVSQEFEAEFLQPLLPQLQLTITAVQEMSDTMQKAERACRDRDLLE